jgi:hypothetical protein
VRQKAEFVRVWRMQPRMILAYGGRLEKQIPRSGMILGGILRGQAKNRSESNYSKANFHQTQIPGGVLAVSDTPFRINREI